MRASLLLAAALPFAMGANGGGCGAVSSMSPAPDVSGAWAVSYDGTMQIDVTIGSSIYHQSLPAQGGAFTLTHAGVPITFDIDCTRADVVCPSEVWPASVSIDQRQPEYPHRMWVTIPTQTCSGALVAPAAGTCGAGTNNPDCTPVCNRTVTTSSADAFGVIAEDGASFNLLLGGGVASNGINCVLLGASWAQANLTDSGSARTHDWRATAMQSGEIKTNYAGGCLWVADPNMNGQLQAAIVGASVSITNAFTAVRH